MTQQTEMWIIIGTTNKGQKLLLPYLCFDLKEANMKIVALLDATDRPKEITQLEAMKVVEQPRIVIAR